MPKYRYSGGPRIYEERSLEVQDGDVVEWETAPDFRWSEVSSRKARDSSLPVDGEPEKE